MTYRRYIGKADTYISALFEISDTVKQEKFATCFAVFGCFWLEEVPSFKMSNIRVQEEFANL